MIVLIAWLCLLVSGSIIGVALGILAVKTISMAADAITRLSDMEEPRA